jgi:hypothetical protein
MSLALQHVVLCLNERIYQTNKTPLECLEELKKEWLKEIPPEHPVLLVTEVLLTDYRNQAKVDKRDPGPE